MFDLEAAIDEWRKRLRRTQALQDGDVADLEAYLRDKVDAGSARGLGLEEAFVAARAEFAAVGDLDDEFFRARSRRRGGRPPWRTPRFVPPLLWRELQRGLRRARRQQAAVLIAVGGLAVGLAAAAFVAMLVRFEHGHDRHHLRAGSIFRVVGEEFTGAPYSLLKSLGTLPGIEAASAVRRLTESDNPVLVLAGGKKIGEDRLFAVDPSFFDIFTVDMRSGRPGAVLRAPQSAVLTESAARRYFGTTDCMGRTFQVAERAEFRVDGVIRDFPSRSHFRFHVLVPTDAVAGLMSWQDDRTSWTSWNYLIYVLLKPGASAASIGPMIGPLFPGKQRQLNLGESMDPGRLRLQALTDIHLRSHLRGEIEANGDIRYLRLIAAIAVLILVSSAFNFINLTTARSLQRCREVGLRKVMGADRFRIIRQFLGEAWLETLAAAALSVGLLGLALPGLADLSGSALTWADVSWPALLACLAAFVLIVGTAAGSYPAFVASRFQPARTLKGERSAAGGRSGVRSVLLAFQFAVSCGLVIAALVFRAQLHLLQTKDLGIDKDQIIMVDVPRPVAMRLDALKEGLLGRPGILAASGTDFEAAADQTSYQGFEWEGKAPDADGQVRWIAADVDFVKTMGLQIVAGRDFRPGDETAGTRAFLINESAARCFGRERAEGRWMKLSDFFADRMGYVGGVVKDFHFRSLHHAVEPVVILAAPSRFVAPAQGRFKAREGTYFSGLAVRAAKSDLRGAMGSVQAFLQANVPENPGAWSFLAQATAAAYARAHKLARLFLWLSILASALAGLGVFGLSAFLIERRRKEISIRKVLGAPAGSLVHLFSRSFLLLLAGAAAAAIPLDILVLRKWLGEFAYQVVLGPWYFAGGVLLVAGLLVAAVGWNTLKAAAANPADNLRSE